MAKETITLELDKELMDRLRATGEDPAEVVRRHLVRRFAAPPEDEARAFERRNGQALEAYGREVEERGTLSERLNGWS